MTLEFPNQLLLGEVQARHIEALVCPCTTAARMVGRASNK